MKLVYIVLLAGVWIILPASPILMAQLANTDLGFIFFAVIAWPSLTAIAETLVISYYHEKKSIPGLSAIIPLGWLSQYFLIVIIFSSLGPEPAVLLLGAWFMLPFVIVQALTAAVYAGLVWLGKSTKLKLFAHTWSRGFILILLIIALTIGWFVVLNLRSKKLALEATQGGYDKADVAYRSSVKAKTKLGQLARPLRIIQTPQGYLGIPLSSERISLPLLNSIGTANIEQLFLDIITDRIYYVRNGTGYVHDLSTNKTASLPVAMNEALRTRKIIATHGRSIALASGGGLAGTGDVIVYDTEAGSSTSKTIYIGYDDNRVLLFWINGRGYRLFMEARGASYDRTSKSKNDNMSLYLEDYPESYRVPSQDEMIDYWGKVVFSGDNDWFFKDRTPILVLKTNHPTGDNETKFSVRNVYILKDGRLAVEIEDRLVVMDLSTRQTEIIDEPVSVEDHLKYATLFSADDENAYLFQGYCAFNNDIYALLQESGNKFIFCLK